MKYLRLFVVAAISIAMTGCMVTPLKKDTELFGHKVSNTVLIVPNTKRYDGYSVPAGIYYPRLQTGRYVFFESRKLVTVDAPLSPRGKRTGGIAIDKAQSEGEGKINAMLWYWEGGYLSGPLPDDTYFRLMALENVGGTKKVIAEHGVRSSSNKSSKLINDSDKPVIKLIIEETEEESHTAAFGSIIYSEFEQSGLFSSIQGESEHAANSVVVIFNAHYNEEKQNNANMLVSALSVGLIPFRHNWNYSCKIKVMTNNNRHNKEYYYKDTSSEYVNIMSDLELMHKKVIDKMLSKFFDELKQDRIYAKMH